MEQLIHLIYASSAVAEPTRAELVELLRVARRNNERAGITGMLLYSAGGFFQVLEGELGEVDRVFATISDDPRHTRVVSIIRERISRRSFGEWSMGFVAASPEEVGGVVGRNDFFADASCLDDLGVGRAKKLLARFRDGAWRARVEGTPRRGALRHG